MGKITDYPMLATLDGNEDASMIIETAAGTRSVTPAVILEKYAKIEEGKNIDTSLETARLLYIFWHEQHSIVSETSWADLFYKEIGRFTSAEPKPENVFQVVTKTDGKGINTNPVTQVYEGFPYAAKFVSPSKANLTYSVTMGGRKYVPEIFTQIVLIPRVTDTIYIEVEEVGHLNIAEDAEWIKGQMITEDGTILAEVENATMSDFVKVAAFQEVRYGKALDGIYTGRKFVLLRYDEDKKPLFNRVEFTYPMEESMGAVSSESGYVRICVIDETEDGMYIDTEGRPLFTQFERE